MGSVLEWSLIDGALPVVVSAAGGVSAVYLVAGHGRRWWLRSVPVAAATAVVVTVALTLVVDRLWRPFPDALPTGVLVWVGVGLGAVTLGVARSSMAGWRRRVLVCGCVVLVWGAAGVQVDRYYGQYPTVRSALGLAPVGQVDLSRLATATGAVTGTAPGESLAQRWRPPPHLPARGVVSAVKIPSPVSRFAARTGWVYLPPAYLAVPRPLLPVLVLLAGQPGSPRDWLDGGRLADMLDTFAAAHAGLAPVTVIPDDLGSALANPLCLDSRLGNVQTFLSIDVPAWITRTLQVDTDPRRWAIGGYSHGGTCSLQLALQAPRVYPTFIDISGQQEPTLGDRQRTVRAAYGGDQAAFVRVNPLDVLATARFPGTAGMIVAGRQDDTYRPQQLRVFAACRAAGLQVRFLEIPGGHNWAVWGPGLRLSLPWWATRVGLTP